MKSEAGFTVLEALVVLAIIAVTAAVAIPGVATSAAEARLDRAAAEYAGALQEARANAIAQSTTWTVSVPVPGTAAYTLRHQDSLGQWQVSRSASLAGATVAATSPAGVTQVSFAPSGGPDPACTITLSSPGGGSVRAILIQPATGRIVVNRQPR